MALQVQKYKNISKVYGIKEFNTAYGRLVFLSKGSKEWEVSIRLSGTYSKIYLGIVRKGLFYNWATDKLVLYTIDKFKDKIEGNPAYCLCRDVGGYVDGCGGDRVDRGGGGCIRGNRGDIDLHREYV